MKPKADIDRNEVERLLQAAQEAQTTYWNALRELEKELDRELDGLDSSDLEGWTVDDVIDMCLDD